MSEEEKKEPEKANLWEGYQPGEQVFYRLDRHWFPAIVCTRFEQKDADGKQTPPVLDLVFFTPYHASGCSGALKVKMGKLDGQWLPLHPNRLTHVTPDADPVVLKEAATALKA